MRVMVLIVLALMAGCSNDYDVSIARHRVEEALIKAEVELQWMESDPVAYAAQVERRECRDATAGLPSSDRRQALRDCNLLFHSEYYHRYIQED